MRERSPLRHSGHRHPQAHGQSHQRNSGYCVGGRHQRGMQKRRDTRDDLVSKKCSQHENVERRYEFFRSHYYPFETVCPSAAATRWFTICPLWMTQVGPTTSSFMSIWSSPSLMRRRRKASTLFEYKWLACVGTVAARLSGARMVTSPALASCPGWLSAQLPPVEAARSTMTDPGRMARTASSVTSKGARLPGTCAVVMITSALAAFSAIWRRKRSITSSVNSRA